MKKRTMDSVDQDKKEQTPAERSLLRTEDCVACDCETFVFVKFMDGFRTCFCHHTQHAHNYSAKAKVT